MSEEWVGESRITESLLLVRSDGEVLLSRAMEGLWEQAEAAVAQREGGPWGITSFCEEWSYDPKDRARVARLTCEIALVDEEGWKVEDE